MNTIVCVRICTLMSVLLLGSTSELTAQSSPLAPYGSTGAPSSADSTNLRVFEAIGLRARGDAVIVSGLRRSEEELRIQRNFRKVLALAAKPELIDDPWFTGKLASLFRPGEIRRYVEPKLATFKDASGPNAWENIGELEWSGRDQFEREDTRRSFIADMSARIKALTPVFPIKAIAMLPVETGPYNVQKSLLATTRAPAVGGRPIPVLSENGSLDTGYMDLSVSFADPVSMPAHITVTEPEARSIKQTERELVAAKAHPPTLLVDTRFSIDKARFRNRDIIFDTTFVDWGLYADANRTRLVFQLPVTAKTFVSTPAPTGPVDLPMLDVEFPRLLLAKRYPQLLDDPSYLRQTFEARRELEKRMVNWTDEGRYISNWPRRLPNGIVLTNLDPDDEDLAAFKAWTRDRIQTLGSRVRYTRVPLTQEANRSVVNLSKSFSYWDSGGFSNFSAMVTRAKTTQPDVVDIALFTSQRDLPVLIAMAPNPHWFHIPATETRVEMNSLAVEYEVESISVERASVGDAFAVMRLRPEILTQKQPGTPEARRSLTFEPGPEFPFAILGIKLGTTRDDAISRVQSVFSDKDVRTADFPFKGSDTFQSFTQIDVLDGQVLKERLFLGYDHRDANKRLLFIKRAVRPESFDKDIADEVLRNDNRAAMIAAYGPPTWNDSRRNEHFWSLDPVIKDRIGTLNCRPSGTAVYDYNQVSPFIFARQCGVLLVGWVINREISFMLYDNASIAKAAESMLASKLKTETEKPRQSPLKM